MVGCYAQLKPQEIAAIPGVDLVLGANEKFDLAAHIEEVLAACHSGLEPESQAYGEEEGSVRHRVEPGVTNAGGVVRHRVEPGVTKDEVPGVTTPGGVVKAGAIKEVKRFIPSYNANDRTRTFLKVQDGCDYFCSFCTIPLARGRSRSGTIAETVAIAERIAATGVKEIVLTGVNTGDFGRAPFDPAQGKPFDSAQGKPADSAQGRPADSAQGRPAEDFLGLIQALDQVEGIERFRISSIEPNLCHDGIIDFVAGSKRFAPHFHMPLQSGSDAILERMRRRYDTALYAERVQRIKERMPHACIGVDVITGTPGETEEEFQKTHAFLRSIAVDYLHVFTYSERANTTAVRMEDSVPMELRRERTKQLRILSSKLQRAFHERHLGSVRPVLFELGEGGDHLEGYTDNYIRVVLPHDPALVNRLVPVALERINGDGQVVGMIRTDDTPLVDPASTPLSEGRGYRIPVANETVAD
ncbi:MAG: MiaB/RimO family radical SAM methylthiotransferase [Flavobacteriales bacterium]|nr:MiaB/RimO family radical SAM methylthiotransferase [Flavobacteriales bacterium]